MVQLDPILRDLRLAFRGLLRDRGFTATALLTFALCLGANVALFAVVNAVLIHPLPYPNPAELVNVFNSYPKAGVDQAGASVPHYLERRAGVAAFADAAAWRDGGVTIGESGSPDRVASMSVTPSYFHVLGVGAALGRTFTDEEGVYGKNDVVVLSDGFWRQAYGASPDALGKKIRMNGTPETIIGVMPPGFHFGTSEAKLWTPLCFSDDDRKDDQRHSNNMSMLARLRPGFTIAAAQAQVDALNKNALAKDPYAKLVIDAGFHAQVVDLHDDLVVETRPALLLLQAGVLFLLLIGAVNLANLLLVRASARDKEFSVRQVLGAGGIQIARQLIAESVALALVGGVLGLALGWIGLRGLGSLGINDLPHFAPYRLDTRVCLVALAASLVTGLLLAVPTVWHSLRGNLALSLSVESRGGTTSRSAHRLRHALIVAQFALAFTLLSGAGLLGLSFSKLLAVNPGFRTENLLTGSVPLPYSHYKDDKDRLAFTVRLLQDLRSLPGVTAAAIATSMPFSGDQDDNAVSIEGQPPAPGESLRTHYTSGVTGDFFDAMGIPLHEGRLINSDDSARSAMVCVIDEDVARRYWPGKSA
ncbi:MAG TPA: ABC transporter permease, partial [Opitutaceae bacterium]